MEEEIYKDKPAMIYGDCDDTEMVNGIGLCPQISRTLKYRDDTNMFPNTLDLY